MRDLASDRGFSLLEVLIASIIVVVALLSLAQLLVLATIARGSAARATLAAVIAADKMEGLRAMTWQSLQAQVGEASDALDRGGAPMATTTAAAYSRHWSIAPLSAGTVVIRVTVRGGNQGVDLVTLRTSDGP